MNVINTLAQGDILAEKYKNHPLKGNLKGFYDCHVLPDLVLIYKIEKEKLILLLFDIESHSIYFKGVLFVQIAQLGTVPRLGIK